jgi:hypothetical protein
MPLDEVLQRSSSRAPSGTWLSARSRLSFTLSMSRAKPVLRKRPPGSLLIGPARDVLHLGRRIQRLGLRFLKLRLKLGKLVMFLAIRGFRPRSPRGFLGLVVTLVHSYPINLVSACAV